MKNLERLYKALASKRRLAILAYLRHESRASVGSIAEAIRLSMHSTSKHLGKLKGVDIVESEQVRKEVYYRLCEEQKEPVRFLLKQLR